MISRLSGSYTHLAPGVARSRFIEDAGFVTGLALLGLRGLSELVHEWVGMLVELRPHGHPFPAALILSAVLLVAPKWLGRATAGKVWTALGGGAARLLGRGRPAGPGEPEP